MEHLLAHAIDQHGLALFCGLDRGGNEFIRRGDELGFKPGKRRIWVALTDLDEVGIDRARTDTGPSSIISMAFALKAYPMPRLLRYMR